jgi:predicted nuclease of predicted toxin-antitoxin system
MRFVIDEDMPRSLGPALVIAGHEALDVRDHGLRGKGDAAVFRFAQEHACALMSEDLGFGNLLKFPLSTHHGIVVGRFPSTLNTRVVVTEILRAIGSFTAETLRGCLVIVEVGQTRVRRPKP